MGESMGKGVSSSCRLNQSFGKKTRPICILVLIFGIALLRTAKVHADLPWRVGFASVDITPEEPMPMCGYASRENPSDGVLHPIYAKAMAIGTGTMVEERAVLISIDLAILHRRYARELARRIQEVTGLERRQILINISHTHTGPLLFAEWWKWEVTDEQQRRMVVYRRALREKIVSLVQQAFTEMEPANLAHGTGVADFVMNRRQYTEQGVRMGPNPAGYADRSVPVLRVTGKDGRLRGIVFGCAAHNVALGAIRKFSGDYAGVARQYIEQKHPGVQALFVTGCAGSANPYPRSGVESTHQHGHNLAEEVLKVAGGDLQPLRGPFHAVLGYVGLPLQTPSREEIKAMAEHHDMPFNAKRMLTLLDKGEALPTHFEVPIAVWQFGEDLTLVGLPEEVVGEYVPLIGEVIGRYDLWLAGYCNVSCGYLPTAQMIDEGGHETLGLNNISTPGYFAKDAEVVLLEKVRELSRQAGRILP